MTQSPKWVHLLTLTPNLTLTLTQRYILVKSKNLYRRYRSIQKLLKVLLNSVLYDPVTQLGTPSNPVTPNLTLNLSLKHSTPTPKHLPQSKTLRTFLCQIFSTEDIGPFDSSFHSLSNGVSLVINFFKSKNLYRRYRSIQKLFESSIQRCII